MSNINPGPNVTTTPNTSFGVVTGTITQQAGPQTVGTGLTNPNMQATGSVNNYCQVSNQNTSSGVNASSDHIVYPDNILNDGTGFMDMGICSSGYAQAQYSITGSNDGYVFMSSPVGNTAASGDMVFGTDSNGTSNGYRWYTGGFGQAISAYAMKLTSTGLTVSGSITGTLSTAAQPNITSVGALTGLTTSADVTIHGITLGLGAGAVNTNVVFGLNALPNNTTGNATSAIGRNTGYSQTTGSYNTYIGQSAGYTATPANANITGSYNTWLGVNAGPGTTTQLSNSTAIGYGATNLNSNEMVLGNASLTSVTTAAAITAAGLTVTAPVASGITIPTIVSATTIAPTAMISFVSGATAITTITPPSTFTKGGQITLIPTGLFTTATTGNIALASVAVVSKALILSYDATSAKWYPSY